MKTLERKRKISKTYVSGNDDRIFKLTGDEYEDSAKRNFALGDYRAAALEHKNAARCYKEAFDKSGSEEMHTMYVGASLAGKKAHRMAALYRATEKKPFLIRGLIRKIKAEHIMGLFIFSILFSAPSITGGVIGNYSNPSFLGIAFFFISLLFSYIWIWGNFLSNRFTDQY